jgi:synaptobrevin family protein YKT6
MVKLLALALFKHAGVDAEPISLGLAAELSSFGYFQRGSVKEMIQFLTRTIVQRTQPGQRQTVKQEDYYCHVHVKGDGLAAIAVTDRDYPPTAAFSVVGKAMDDYVAQHGDAAWRAQAADSAAAQDILDGELMKYQDPAAADKLTKIQRDLDDTKVVLHQTIESVLRRGEKLDSLVDKSHDLSMASQMFYKQARKTNSCCKMM